MQLRIFRHLWGVSDRWQDVFPQIVAAGYAGIEAELPSDDELEGFAAALRRHGLDYIAQVQTVGDTVAEHVLSLQGQLEHALRLAPHCVVAMSGRDSWTQPQSEEFFGRALELEATHAIAIAHETHRSTAFYSPWPTQAILQRFAQLKVCCDYSHWVVVTERLLADAHDVIALTAEHAHHVHARVGYEQGPQVPDPAAPEARAQLEAHEDWWDQIWDAQQRRGLAVSTLTPEYGPPPYLHTLPYTSMPTADPWQVTNWHADRLRERFRSRGAGAGAGHHTLRAPHLRVES
jgi:hypothetical protein